MNDLRDSLHALLDTTRVDADPRLLERAVQPGRVLGIATDAWAEAVGAPHGADGSLRRALREARALHSRERRLVADALAALVRLRPVLEAVVPGPPQTSWLAFLVHLGAPLELAAHQDPAHAEVLARALDLPEHALAWLQGLEPDVALGRLLGVVGPDALAASVGVAARQRASSMPALVTAMNARPELCLRVNVARASRDDVLAELARAGVDARLGRWSPWAVKVPAGTPLHTLAAAREGRVEPQDEASQLVSALVAPRRGERVLDLCAGAGGKSLALAAALGGTGTLWATDVRASALVELRKRAARAGASVRTACLHEGVPDADVGGPFDAVLVDAPCSGSGVWRRHPAYRWRLDTLDGLAASQREVTDLAASLLKPGGRLVYATCSFLPAEDEVQAQAFAERSGLRRVGVDRVLPWLDGSLVRDGNLLALPHSHDTDAFFATVFERP